jgi:hypothetical protein
MQVDEELEGFQKDSSHPPGSSTVMLPVPLFNADRVFAVTLLSWQGVKATDAAGQSTFEMTVNHSKLLILISKYAQVSRPE